MTIRSRLVKKKYFSIYHRIFYDYFHSNNSWNVGFHSSKHVLCSSTYYSLQSIIIGQNQKIDFEVSINGNWKKWLFLLIFRVICITQTTNVSPFSIFGSINIFRKMNLTTIVFFSIKKNRLLIDYYTRLMGKIDNRTFWMFGSPR